MKQSEKLDVILRTLYQYRSDGGYYSIQSICESQNIPIVQSNEVTMLARRLKDDGYIRAIFTKGDTSAILTSYGIEYCEEDSYAYKGHALISNVYNLTISNSPNANIVSNSSNVNVAIKNSGDIKKKFEQVKLAINRTTEIDSAKKEEILDCIEEVENNINAGKKPKHSFNSLAHLCGSLSEVGLLIIELKHLIFGG